MVFGVSFFLFLFGVFEECLIKFVEEVVVLVEVEVVVLYFLCICCYEIFELFDCGVEEIILFVDEIIELGNVLWWSWWIERGGVF